MEPMLRKNSRQLLDPQIEDMVIGGISVQFGIFLVLEQRHGA
jgi:hypothetical protein